MILAIEAYRRGFTPTYVAGFRAWLDLNRVCRKGEGIRILAPVAVKERDAHGEENTERRVFFKTVTVWDTSSRVLSWGHEPAVGRTRQERASGVGAGGFSWGVLSVGQAGEGVE